MEDWYINNKSKYIELCLQKHVTEYLIFSIDCSTNLKSIISFNPVMASGGGNCYYSHLIDEQQKKNKEIDKTHKAKKWQKLNSIRQIHALVLMLYMLFVLGGGERGQGSCNKNI